MIKIENFKFNNIEEIYIKIKQTLNEDYVSGKSISEYLENLHQYNYNIVYGQNKVSISDIFNHNILNKTYNKMKVPSLKLNDYNTIPKAKYCPECGKNNNNFDIIGVLNAKLYNMQEQTLFINNHERDRIKLKIEAFKCLDCGHIHDIEDTKLLNNTSVTILGEVFINEDKISLSAKYLRENTNTKTNSFYYEEGYTRLTFNTKTGYTYTTNKGLLYKKFNRIWSRRNGLNSRAPVMFNSTYCNYDGANYLIEDIAHAKAIQEACLLPTKEEIAKFDIDSRRKKLEYEIKKQVTDALFDKVQLNVDYELNRLSDKASYNNITLTNLKRFNRFYNLNPFSPIYSTLRDNDIRFNKVKRDEISLLQGLSEMNNVKLGKKAKKIAIKNESDIQFYTLASLAILCFKNPDNLHKIFKACENQLEHRFKGVKYMNLQSYQNIYEFWSKYRNENYLVSEFIKTHIKNSSSKLEFVRDALFLVNQIKIDLGEDVNIDSIVDFKNEKQFHDDLSKYINSDSYQDIVNAEKNKRIFDLENEVLALEEPDNNILIARTHGELSRIGSKMGICVGGYSHSVDRKQCRIAYIRDKDTHNYKCCIELRPIFKGEKRTEITGYSIVQAKLKYNQHASSDEYMNTLINNWAKKHNIQIHTYDVDQVIEL